MPPTHPSASQLLSFFIATMKSVIFAAAIASAAAFAPAQVGKTTTSLNAFESALGAQAPLGFWDPLGFLDRADQETFDRLRYVELKHGRVSQLAFVGNLITRAGYHLPGNITPDSTFDSYPNGLAAINGADAIPTPALIQTLAFIGFLELKVMTDVTGDSQFAGDFRNGFDFGWDKQSPEWQEQKRAVELNQGRAAMMGILGLMVHEQLGGELPIVGTM
ncbi:chlorophyll a-b binding domain-containing protein [Skeletonema marinoi]|uniref:Chlorophyll a-b binding domain-containing protein n=3 Tax=Eukaryota TaxID=2759 RepID=A0AAD8XSJ9_9STRA|nr:chlorophyll a-b binding domain-containing protein [Skeletonema marinoi]